VKKTTCYFQSACIVFKQDIYGVTGLLSAVQKSPLFQTTGKKQNPYFKVTPAEYEIFNGIKKIINNAERSL